MSFVSAEAKRCIVGNSMVNVRYVKTLLKEVESRFGVKTDYSVIEEVDEETLRTSAEMFIFLVFCPPKQEFLEASKNIKDNLKIYSPNNFLIALSRLGSMPGNVLFKESFANILHKVRLSWKEKGL